MIGDFLLWLPDWVHPIIPWVVAVAVTAVFLKAVGPEDHTKRPSWLARLLLGKL